MVSAILKKKYLRVTYLEKTRIGYRKTKNALVTGAAGYIGFHLSKRLLDEGWRVVGSDCMSNYYDVSPKERRESMLLQNVSYRSVHEKVETPNVLLNLFEEEQPEIVIHLAAQAGARYSIENPRAYLESNIIRTCELLEGARVYWDTFSWTNTVI